MYLLDTDHLSLLERSNTESLSLQRRLEQVPPDEIATTIITYEEQMRGWLARAAQATTIERMLTVYSRLQTLLSRNLADFTKIPGLRVEDWTR